MSTKRRGAGEGSIYRRADGRWAATVSTGWASTGRTRHTVYGKTRTEAAASLRRLQHQLSQGLPVVDERTTVRTYLESWLRVIEPRVRASTFTRYRGLVDHQIIPALGTVKLSKLQPPAVTKMLADLQQGGLSPRTCHHVRAVLRTALQDGMRERVLAQNAATLARGPKVESYRVEPMSPTHAGAILDAVAGTGLEAPVACALWTGLRQSELLGLHWADLDLDARRLSVTVTLQRRGGAWYVEPTKTDKSRRTVSLPAPLVDTLSAHRLRQREAQLMAGPAWDSSFGDLVFTASGGGPLVGTGLTRRFHEAQVRAGLIPIRFHDLRHAAATLMLASGVDLKVVSELLGHSTIATTANVYAGVLDSLKVDAADRLTRLMAR